MTSVNRREDRKRHRRKVALGFYKYSGGRRALVVEDSGRLGFTARLPLLYCGLLAQYGIGAARLQIHWSMHCEATAL